MAEIQPFRALRYDFEKVGDPAAIACPPYDLIDPEEAERLRRRHPHNVIRLILGKGPCDGLHKERDYIRAGELLKKWLEEGILIREEVPAFYIYEQEFDDLGTRRIRRALVGRVRLEEYGSGKIFPHERTLSGPRQDRLSLMKATEANLSPVFSIFPDEKKGAAAFIENLCRRNPLFGFRDETGVTHRLYIIREEKATEQLRRMLSDEVLLIADGHHRYETAIEYMRLSRCLQKGEAPPAVNYVMMACVPMSDPGLAVQAFHRLVRGIPDFRMDRFLERASDLFEVKELEWSGGRLDGLFRAMAETRQKHSFGLASSREEKLALLILRREDCLGELRDRSEALRRLDVTILHEILLKRLLGLKGSGRNLIYYEHDPAKVLDALESGSYRVAFLLNPPDLSALREIAAHGEKMPPKSTYFYPKVFSGLLFNLLRE